MGLDISLLKKDEDGQLCSCLTEEECSCDLEQFVPVYSTNITHNLRAMADEAGIKTCLWYIEETDIKTASQLTPLLEEGLRRLIDKPNHFKQFDSKNGWGVYDDFVEFVQELINACKEHPDAVISSSR